MSRIPFANLGKSGVVKDVGGHRLDFTAWTDVNNVRCVGPYVEKAAGYSLVHSANVVPYFVTTLPSGQQTYHVYAGLDEIHAFIGTQTAEITRASGDYTGGAEDYWNSAVFNGLLLLNNNQDLPQVWSAPGLSQLLVDLPNWPASTTAAVLRPFKNYLVALDVTKPAGREPRLIKWSHSASVGVPTSWDESDATVEANEQTLAEGQDFLVDCLPFGDINVVYGESSTWRMTLTQVPFVFSFKRAFPDSGLLAQGCASNLGPPVNSQFAVTLTDIILHNGYSYQSIVEGRLREWFFENINPQAKSVTRTVVNRKQKEVWVLFPYGETTVLNMALVWNWVYNTWSIRDIPQSRSVVAIPIEVSSEDAWGVLAGSWGVQSQEWGSSSRARAALNSVLLADIQNSKILLVDSTFQADSVNYTSYVERRGLDVSMGREGLFHNPQRERMGHSIYPYFEGSSSIVFTVKLGHHDTPDGAITWDDSGSWSPGTEKIDLYATGRYLAVRFEESSALAWRAYGFDLDMVELGVR